MSSYQRILLGMMHLGNIVAIVFAGHCVRNDPYAGTTFCGANGIIAFAARFFPTAVIGWLREVEMKKQ